MENRHHQAGGRVKALPLSILTLLLLFFASCQETDDTLEAYPDWRNKNEQAFLKLYQEAKDAIAAGDKSWTLVRGCLRADSIAGEQVEPTDYIIAQMLENGTGTASPFYTDTVAVHYSGRLQPSTYYPQGLNFDNSFYGSYDPAVSTPYHGRVGGFIEGFSTALQKMHRGDHWRVYIPYQLGYGSATTSSIPAYSMLIFDMWLSDFWSKKEGDRPDKTE